MRLQPIIDQLREQCGDILRQVGDAAAYELAADSLRATPAAFVIPDGEQAGSNEFFNQGVEQRVATTFAVVIACPNVSDTSPSGNEAIEPVRERIREALLNWSVADGFDNIEFDHGTINGIDNGVLWWSDYFRTAYYIRSV